MNEKDLLILKELAESIAERKGGKLTVTFDAVDKINGVIDVGFKSITELKDKCKNAEIILYNVECDVDDSYGYSNKSLGMAYLDYINKYIN